MKFYKIAFISLLILMITGILYLIPWFIRPSEFLNMTIGVPHLTISIILFLLIPILALLGALKTKKIKKNLLKIIALYFLNLGLYVFIILYGHSISVSEICIENRGNKELTNISVTYPSHPSKPPQRIFIDKIDKNSKKNFPIIPHSEGELSIKGRYGNKNFKNNVYIAEIQAYKNFFIIKSSNNIEHKKEIIENFWFNIIDNI